MTGASATAAGRARARDRWLALLERDHLAVLAGSVLLVVVGFLGDGDLGDAAGQRSGVALAEAKRAALTDEALRDAYAFRAPYALRWFVSRNRTTTLAEEVTASRDTEAAGRASDFLVADSVALRVTEPIAEPLVRHDFNAAAYIEAAAGDALPGDGSSPDEAVERAEAAERSALRLRFVAVVLALAVAVAGVSDVLAAPSRRLVVHGSWVLVAGATALLVVEVVR